MIIGICGGSGSGKTVFASLIEELLGNARCSLLHQDSYYLDQSHRFDGDGGSVNFDHPNAIDFLLISQHLGDLKNGRSIQVPCYDYKTHRRLDESHVLRGRPLIILEGMLILSHPAVRAELDVKVFIDAPEQARFARRLSRDTRDRGRNRVGVEQQLKAHVKPMHDLFVEPSKAYADKVYSGEGNLELNVRDLLRYIGSDSKLC